MFTNIKSVVGDYIAGSETVESIQSVPSPRKVGKMKNTRTKEELEGDYNIQQLHISTVESQSKESKMCYLEPRKKNPRRSSLAIAEEKYFTV